MSPRVEGSSRAQPEKALHRREIAIVVQQRMSSFDAEGGDDEIDRLADRYAFAAQKSVIRGGLDRQFGIEQRDCPEAPQDALDELCFALDPQSLQHLAENQIADQQWPRRDQRAKPAYRIGRDIVQMIDPYGAIDEDHRGKRPWRLSSRSPCHRTFPARWRISSCSFSRISARSPASTAARLVLRPVRRRACSISASSISILVRIMASMCIRIKNNTHQARGNDANGELADFGNALSPPGRQARRRPRPVRAGAASGAPGAMPHRAAGTPRNSRRPGTRTSAAAFRAPSDPRR